MSNKQGKENKSFYSGPSYSSGCAVGSDYDGNTNNVMKAVYNVKKHTKIINMSNEKYLKCYTDDNATS